MKTAVFWGLMLIARSIDSEYFKGDLTAYFYAGVLVIFIICDVVGFLADNGFIDWKNGDNNGY